MLNADFTEKKGFYLLLSRLEKVAKPDNSYRISWNCPCCHLVQKGRVMNNLHVFSCLRELERMHYEEI